VLAEVLRDLDRQVVLALVDRGFVTRSAVLISGSSAESNATSTTGPMTWTTRPIEFGEKSVAMMRYP
jgi:hypothetical protein